MPQILTHSVTNITGSGTGDVSPWDASTGQGTAGSNNNKAIARVAGSFANLRVKLGTAPGAGTSRAFAVVINGSESALTVTISDTDTEASSTASVSVAAGDHVAIRQTATNSPGVPGAGTITLEWTPTDSETLCFGGQASHADGETIYLGVPATGSGGAGSLASLTVPQNVMPLSGTLTGLRVKQEGTNGLTFTVVKNGVEQDGTGGTVNTVVTTVSNGDDEETTFSLSVSAGDRLALKIVCGSGIFGSFSVWGVSFVPDTAGESPRCGSNYGASINSGTRYHYVGGSSAGSWTTTESDVRRHGSLTTYTIKDLYVLLPSAPGAGKSYTFSLMVNGSAAGPTVTISDTDTSGSDTSTAGVVVLSTDTLSVRVVPSGTPTDVNPAISWVEYIDESGILGVGGLEFTGQAPTLAFAGQPVVPVGALAFTGYAPTIYTPPPDVTEIDSAIVEFYLDGAWVDVTADVGYDITVRYGTWGGGPLDRIAQTGHARFWMNNSENNSAGLIGYYSPGHANCRSGFTRGIRARIHVWYLGVQYTVFTGKIFEIRPLPGSKRERRTEITVLDWMDELASFTARLAAQSDKRADELLTTLVNAMPANAQPVATSFDTGIDTFALSFDDLGDGANGLAIAAGVILSELGWLYVSGEGTLVFENRQSVQSATNVGDFDETMIQLAVPGSLARVYNHVRATIYPRETGSSTVVLWSRSPDVVPVVPAGTTRTFYGSYRDPNDEASPVGGTSMVTPVSSTDYVANTQADGGGSDITGDQTVTATYYGSSFALAIANANVADAYFTTLQVRGKPIFNLAPITVESESAQDYGRRTLEIDMPYQDDENVAVAVANYVRAQHEALEGQVEEIMFEARRSHAHMMTALLAEPGDTITVTESVTGISSAPARIGGKELAMFGNKALFCRFSTTPAFVTDAFILDDPVYGELDDDKLGYL